MPGASTSAYPRTGSHLVPSSTLTCHQCQSSFQTMARQEEHEEQEPERARIARIATNSNEQTEQHKKHDILANSTTSTERKKGEEIETLEVSSSGGGGNPNATSDSWRFKGNPSPCCSFEQEVKKTNSWMLEGICWCCKREREQACIVQCIKS